MNLTDVTELLQKKQDGYREYLSYWLDKEAEYKLTGDYKEEAEARAAVEMFASKLALIRDIRTELGL